MAPLKLRVVSPEGYLNARQQPYGELVTQLPDGAIVEALEPAATVRAKVGQHGEWLRVRFLDGREVYLAAWYLQLLSSDAALADSCPVWVHNPARTGRAISRPPQAAAPFRWGCAAVGRA